MSVGYKAAKLAKIPAAWVPPYFSIDEEKTSQRDVRALAEFISTTSRERKFENIIIRSSAVGETLNNRGRFESYEVLEPDNIEEIADKVEAILRQAETSGAKMALVIQKLLSADKKGHFSNERRVSATRNHWGIEIEAPKYESFRTNSQRDTPANPAEPLRLQEGKNLQRLFGSIGSWVNANFEGRAHIEWVFESDKLWIVQLDLEDDAPDEGIDPHKIISFRPHDNSRLEGNFESFFHWSDFPDNDYRKVGSIKKFAKYTMGAYPNVYVLRASDAQMLIASGQLEAKLQNIVGVKLVGRTDVRPSAQDKMQGLNLPRTETSTPATVVEFIEKTLADWRGANVSADDGIFIVHEYLPAVSGVWADAAPDERSVFVDALWGLPDGLQYLDHDSFEYDLKVEQIVSEYVRHKGWFVAEDDDGSWRRRQVRRDLTRHSALSREHVSHIAQVTHELALESKGRLRVMWFVDVRKPGVASLFPWFAHKPQASDDKLFKQPFPDQSLLRSLPQHTVRTPDDLEHLPDGRLRLRLDPDAQFMRDNNLLNRIAAVAVERGHTVELRGSGLCHAYYLLNSLGVAVVTPLIRRYTRVRGRQTFGKLVRDKIPDRIHGRGERVTYFELTPAERRRALAAKLIEEAQEVAGSTNPQDIVSELADVFEIVRSIASLEGIEWNEVEERANDKRDRVGAFDGAKLLVETDIPSSKKRKISKSGVRRTPYQVKESENGVVVPFLSLIEEAVEFNFNKSVFSMRLRPEGVFIEEIPDKDTGAQLNLPLDDKNS